MTTKTNKRLKITGIVILLLVTLSTRFFASSVLGEPFFGETLTNLFSTKEKPVLLSQRDLGILKSVIHPITIENAKNDSLQFDFLNEKLKHVEVIGLGEATHGTKEFFELKNKMFKYLVEKQDVKLFGIEANFAACYDINKYVLTGEGNAKEALSKNGYWVWKSQEVLDLIEWMKNYNKGKTSNQKIKFYGYDMQDATSCVVWLDNYLSNNSPGFNKNLLPEKIEENKTSLKELDDKGLDEMQKTNLNKLKKLEEFVLSKRIELFKKDSTDYKFAKQTIAVLRQKLNYFREQDFNTAYSYRDSSMTQNIKWIRENNNNGKIMLWAHNGHIGKGSFSDDFKSGNWMGTHLNNLYGKKYYNIGFSFSEGGFVSQSPSSTNVFYLMYSFTKSIFKNEPWLVSNNYVKPHSKSYLTNAFSQLKTPIFYIDFEDISNNKNLKDFMNKDYEHYEAGAVYINEKSALWSTNLYEYFDAIIYVDKTKPAENYNLGKIAK
jgi:erythromycin esterase